MSNKNPLNGKGNATVIATPVMFTLAEVLFHAHPIVGSAVALLTGAITYRHYDDVTVGIEKLKGGMRRDYVPSQEPVHRAQSEKEVEEKIGGRVCSQRRKASCSHSSVDVMDQF